VIDKLIEEIQGVAKEAKAEVLKQATDPSLLIKGAQLASQAQKYAEKEPAVE
jgi:hypothetical protein